MSSHHGVICILSVHIKARQQRHRHCGGTVICNAVAQSFATAWQVQIVYLTSKATLAQSCRYTASTQEDGRNALDI